MQGVAKFVTAALMAAVGWAFKLVILLIFYGLGRWVAQYLQLGIGADSVGLLCALAFVWLYENRDTRKRYAQLRSLIDTTQSY